jgi:hypothetical protein
VIFEGFFDTPEFRFYQAEINILEIIETAIILIEQFNPAAKANAVNFNS